MNNISGVLQKCALFQQISQDQLDYFLSHMNYRIETFSEHEVIFSPLKKADHIGIILSGTVDIQKLFPDGKIVIITRKKSPDLIAQASIFSKLTFYPSTAAASQPCKILFISKRELLNLFDLNTVFMLNFLESISNSTLILKHKIGILSLNSIQEKIAGFLIHAKNNPLLPNTSDTIVLPFSKKDWAEYMNVSRTSLSRELRKLETEGILSFDRHTIKINNWGKLETLLSL